MEKLTQDLFKDPALETNSKSTAGARPAPCTTGPGGSACVTGGGADLTLDVLP